MRIEIKRKVRKLQLSASQGKRRGGGGWIERGTGEKGKRSSWSGDGSDDDEEPPLISWSSSSPPNFSAVDLLAVDDDPMQ